MKCRGSGPKGVLIPTAMLIVLIIFSLVTAMHLHVRQTYLTIRWGHSRMQARYMARAAANRLLALLNEDAALQKTCDARHPHRETGAGGTLEAWVERPAPPHPNVLLVMGKGVHESGLAETACLTVVRRSVQPPPRGAGGGKPQGERVRYVEVSRF